MRIRFVASTVRKCSDDAAKELERVSSQDRAGGRRSDAGAFVQPNQALEFRVVVQAVEIGIIGRPIWVAVSGRKGLFERLECLCLFPKDAVGAGSIVEGVRISGSKGDGSLQVPDALVRVYVGKVPSQQDTGAHVFWH